MKRMPLILATLVTLMLLSPPPGFAQTAFNGKWKTEAPSANPQVMDQITMTFKVADTKVTGSIARTQPPGQTPVPLEGTVTLDTITFTVKSPDGARTIAFTGKLKGDEIVFSLEAKGSGGGRGIFGLYGPPTVTAKRMQ
jgi:hypothetical protein